MAAELRSALFLALVLLVSPPLSHGFKAGEFKTCDQAHFCKRNRNRASGDTKIALQSGGLSGLVYKGVLVNKEKNTQLYLQVTRLLLFTPALRCRLYSGSLVGNASFLAVRSSAGA